jgi:hypothetical protein
MRITRRDLEGILDFVHDLCDRRGLEDFADRTMNALLRLVSAERIVYGDFDAGRQAARLSLQPAVVKDPDGSVDGALGSFGRKSARSCS